SPAQRRAGCAPRPRRGKTRAFAVDCVTDILSEANGIFASPRDLHGLLSGLADLAVARLARWCVIDLLDREGAIEQVFFRHADPAREPLGGELARRLCPAIGSGSAELGTGAGTSARLASILGVVDPEIILRLGATGYLFVPLLARGQAIGAMTFV